MKMLYQDPYGEDGQRYNPASKLRLAFEQLLAEL